MTVRRVYKGFSLSPGVAKGRVVFSFHTRPEVGKRRSFQFSDEVRRFFKALGAAKRDLELMKSRIAKSQVQKEVLDVVDVYLMFIEDPSFSDYVVDKIRSGYPADVAIFDFFNEYAEKLLSAGDRYLRERVKDIKYVKRFLLNKLFQTEIDWDEVASRGDILVIPFISPVDVVSVAERGIRGIVVEKGSETSHTSIVARSMGIPMVKLPDATELLREGELVLIDGDKGEVVVEPLEDEVHASPEVVERVEVGRLPVEIYANVDFPEEAKVLKDMGAAGIGIFRTEYMYLIVRSWPSEDFQREYIKRLLSHLPEDMPVTIRIADLGGDKVPVYAEHMREVLDYRGIRFFMKEEGLFMIHLRAIMSAFKGRVLRLLIPMVSDVLEVEWVKERVQALMGELEDRPERVLVGAMVETPAGVINIREISKKVDFVSIGSNDLTSFLFGMDRECKLPEYLEPPNNMVVIECIKRILRVCSPERVTLCGEVARSEKYLPYILSTGLKKLSVNPAFIPKLKLWLWEHLKSEGGGAS